MKGSDGADFFVGRGAFLRIGFVIGIMMHTEESLTGGETWEGEDVGDDMCRALGHFFVLGIKIDIKNDKQR